MGNFGQKEGVSVGKTRKNWDLERNKGLPKGGQQSYDSDEGRACMECRTWKVWNEFGLNSKGRNGRRPICKPCRALKVRSKKAPSLNNSNSGDGVTLVVTHLPSERYWCGLGTLIDFIVDQEVMGAKGE